MIGTFFSLVVAILIFFFSLPEKITDHAFILGAAFFVISSLFVMTQTMITVFSWGPLQKTEQNLIPRIIEAFKNDRNLRYTNLLLLMFLLITYLIAMDMVVFKIFNITHLFIAWTVLLGIAIDLLHHHLNRVMDFLEPYHVVEFYHDSAQKCVRDSKEVELCNWIDTLSEISVKSIAKSSSSLALLSAEKLRSITQNYLKMAKGITYHEDEDAKRFGGADHVSYMLFFLFQRLELIFEKALSDRLEPICSGLITILGKIAIYGAEYDITVAGYPLHYLGRFARRAQAEGLQEVGNRATLTLLEVSKVIIRDVDIKYIPIKETFLSIINIMNEIAKETFRKDKSIGIPILTQPFHDLKNILKDEKVASHQDTPEIQRGIERVLEEFATLESVLRAMPPIPEVMKERPEEEPQE